MSLDRCIPGMVERGEITPEKGREMAGLYGELEQQFRRQFGDQAASAMATDATLKALEADAIRKRRVALAQVQAQKAALKNMASYGGGRDGGPIDPKGAVAMFAPDPKAGYSSVEGRRRAIRARSHAMMSEVLAKHHTGIVGEVRDKAGLEQLVRERFGEDTGSASARQLSDAFERTSEMLRTRANAAGASIGKLEKWGLPQAHDTRAVRAAGFDAWRAEIAPRLDRTRMLDQRTGMPFSEAGFELALRDVFETIRTDGWNKRTAGQGSGRGALANQLGESRFLVFKSADDWMAYQAKFGVGSAFDAMMGHIDGMSRDIALMEVLGPNPNATVGWIKDTIQKSAALDTASHSKATDRAFAATKQIDRYHDEITGAAGRPENRTIALGFSAVRSVQTAAKLGGAMLSAVPTDPAFGLVTRKFNGLPAAGMLRDYVKLFRPGAQADQELAVRLTGIAEEWAKRAGGQQRVLGEELTSEVAKRLAEGALRVTGLNRFTEAGRWAMGMTFVSHITGERGKAFADLDGPFQRTLQRYGITPEGWDTIRRTPLERDGGADWIKPNNVEDHALGDKLYEMILSETDYAVPTPDIRTRALVNSVAPKGTWIGEAIRSAALFKGFGVSMMIMQTRRIMEAATQGKWNAARYAAGLFIATTIGGAIALQLKALAAFKDPRPMPADVLPTEKQFDQISRWRSGEGKRPTPTDAQAFWGAAVLQGGGFGIFGDFLQSSQNRFGGGFLGSLAGPLFQDGQAVFNVAGSQHPAWAAAQLARLEIPGGSTWYVRTAFDRMVMDQIQEQIDPNYRQSWQRMKKRADDQRTHFWWAPGETAPGRAPDFENALGKEGPPQ